MRDHRETPQGTKQTGTAIASVAVGSQTQRRTGHRKSTVIIAYCSACHDISGLRPCCYPFPLLCAYLFSVVGRADF